MDNYILKKKEEKAKITKYNPNMDGYNFKSHHSNSLNINEVLISKPDLVYKRLVMIVLSIMHASDSTEGDCIIALDEVNRLKNILLHNYHKKLKIEKEALFLQQLDSLEMQLHQKISNIRAFREMFSFEQEEKHIGR